ncbi:MAG TPA: GntR family transcriptional regulator [Candidatus Acidoferrum sp.]|nr:GntR family transcriptional regulator [Candidatus Acidoferrum sp.]
MAAEPLAFSFCDFCPIRYSTLVIPFRVTFRPGASLFEQVVYASKKAMISGHLRPGDPFPSVRTLSKELKINPNTAHKAISHLITTGLLETRPGVGTIVANLPEAPSSERTQLLTDEIEQLVVEAKRLRINLEDVTASISEHWKRLGGKPKSPSESNRGSRSQR